MSDLAFFEKPISEKAALFVREPRHAEAYFALIESNREYLRKWLSWVDNVKTADDISRAIDRTNMRFAEGKEIVAGIRLEDQVAGVIGLHDIDMRNGSADIGYWLGCEFKGNGLVTLSCRALLDYAFGQLGLQRVQIRVEPDNKWSKAVPLRLGFQYKGITRCARRTEEGFADMEVYSMLKNEWTK